MTSDSGDIILSGLFRTALFLVLFAVLIHEVGVVMVNTFQLDDAAGTAARAAASSANAGAGELAVEQAVVSSLSGQQGVVIDSVSRTSDYARVELSREPAFLLVGQVPFIREQFRGRVAKTAPLM